MFPMSIPRNASALRFTSIFGVFCTLYLCLTVTIVFFFNEQIVPDFKKNLSEMEAFRLSYQGIVTSVPLIIFAYMYQVNIPMIYVELEKKDAKEMSKVIYHGSTVVVLFYILVGVFGYATFLAPPLSQ